MDILTISQATSYLQVREKTVRRLIEKKELSASKVGRTWRKKAGYRLLPRKEQKYLGDNYGKDTVYIRSGCG